MSNQEKQTDIQVREAQSIPRRWTQRGPYQDV